MTGEAVGILQTKTALVPGTYEHTAIVKDNAGAISSLTINIVVRNPGSPDSKLQFPTEAPHLSWPRPVEMGLKAILD
ncbi:hypothetical protein RvY_15756 [Ramazzottius varieornatus]|uniref:Uncharacterized protein n=1 Tax=Ramazzottius varieornatus TaxID=947166 RepID=A0A1D1W3V5_RAMVA|nr:hypothetical protein RvY_15756 [Ramazzottius varieornatus]